MKKRFTYKDLEDSSTYYYPIFGAIFSANCKLYKTSEQKPPLDTDNPRSSIKNYLNLGEDDFYNISDTINIYNRCFIELLSNADALVAFPLIRLQLENLTAIFAETLYPFQIIHKLFDLGRNLGEVKIKSSYIVPSNLRREIDANYGTTIGDLYKDYSGFINPSKSQMEVDINSYYSYKEDSYVASKKDVKKYAKDMVYVNQIIGNVLLVHLEDIKSKIK